MHDGHVIKYKTPDSRTIDAYIKYIENQKFGKNYRKY